MKFAFIAAEKATYPVRVLCRTLELTFRRSGTRFLPPPLAGIPGSAVGEGRSGQAC